MSFWSYHALSNRKDAEAQSFAKGDFKNTGFSSRLSDLAG